MKGDMGGAACVASTIQAAAQLKLNINLKGQFSVEKCSSQHNRFLIFFLSLVNFFFFPFYIFV